MYTFALNPLHSTLCKNICEELEIAMQGIVKADTGVSVDHAVLYSNRKHEWCLLAVHKCPISV